MNLSGVTLCVPACPCLCVNLRMQVIVCPMFMCGIGCFPAAQFHFRRKDDMVCAGYKQKLALCVLSLGSQRVLKGADITTMKVNQNVFQFNPL